MPSSRRNISYAGIDEEIEKSIEHAKTCKYNIESLIVKNLKIDAEVQQPFRKIKYSYSSYVKLYLFMKLKNIESQTDMVTYLRCNKRDRRRLGFKSTPDQTSISYFMNHILDITTREILDYIVSRIEQIASEKNIRLDTITTKIKKHKAHSKKRNQTIRKKELTRNIIKLYKRRIQPFLTLRLGSNCVYKTEHFTNLLLYMAEKDDFAENGSDTLRDMLREHGIRCPKCHKYIPSFALRFSENDPENQVICSHCNKAFRVSPKAQTMFHHLKKFTIEDIQGLYLRMLEVIWEHARKQNVFKEKNITLACDCTNILYYGDRNTPGATTTTDDTDMMCYRYMTITIVDNGRRFTLMAIPFKSLQDQHKIVNELLLYARKQVNIGLVLFDKGFYSEKMIKVLEEYNLRYIINCPRNTRVKEIIETGDLPKYIADYPMKNVVHNLVINTVINREGEEVPVAYATNLPMDENDIEGSADRVSSTYRKRWGIETSYRIIKHSFGLRTTSRDFRIRLFYFLFSVILYNLWILIDLLVWIDLFEEIGETHLVKSKSFRALLFIVDPG
jgi:putative transposase